MELLVGSAITQTKLYNISLSLKVSVNDSLKGVRNSLNEACMAWRNLSEKV